MSHPRPPPRPLVLALFLLARVGSSSAGAAPIEVSLTAPDGARLSGQLDLPAGGVRPALVFMIPGLGRHDRDGNSSDWGQLDNLRFMAGVLTAEGFAVFRMDKRGVGRSEGKFTDTRRVVAGDFVSGYAAAVARPEIDPTQVIILAQSFGSIVLGRHYKQFRAVHRPVTVVLLSNGARASYINNIDAPIHIVNGRHDWNPLDRMVRRPLRVHRKRYGFDDTAYIAEHADHALFDRRYGKTVHHHGGAGPYVMHAGAMKSIVAWCKVYTR